MSVRALSLAGLGAVAGLGAAAALTGCGQPEQPACDLDAHTIGKWLADKRIGTEPRYRRAWETDYSQMIFWLDFSADNWCADMPAGTNTACWLPEGESRPECQEARARLDHVSVTGPICGYWLPWLSSDVFAREGMRVAADEYKTIPFDMICINNGGLPLGCFGDPEADPRCSRIFSSVRKYLPDALP